MVAAHAADLGGGMSAVPWTDDELALLGEQVARFLEREFVLKAPAWEARGPIDPESWQKAAEAGLRCAGIPETYSGGSSEERRVGKEGARKGEKRGERSS